MNLGTRYTFVFNPTSLAAISPTSFYDEVNVVLDQEPLEDTYLLGNKLRKGSQTFLFQTLQSTLYFTKGDGSWSTEGFSGSILLSCKSGTVYVR